jgi:iron complex outermembrane receptor protein
MLERSNRHVMSSLRASLLVCTALSGVMLLNDSAQAQATDQPAQGTPEQTQPAQPAQTPPPQQTQPPAEQTQTPSSQTPSPGAQLPPVTVQAARPRPRSRPQTAPRARTVSPPALPRREATRAAPPPPMIPTPSASVPPTGTVGQPPPAYAGGQVGSGTRVGVLGNQNVFDTPFSTIGYTAQLMRDQQARSVADVLTNDPSVRAVTATSSALLERFFIRGFDVTPTDMAFDGLYGVLNSRRPAIDNIERVEVLKGPSALLNGMAPFAGIGGTVNFIPKRAYDEPLNRLTTGWFSLGTIGQYADIGRRFGEKKEWGIRVNGTYTSGETAIHSATQIYGFGSVGLDYRGEQLRVSFDAGYQQFNLGAQRGFQTLVPAIKIPAPPPLALNQSQPSEFDRVTHRFLASRAEYDIAPNTTVYAAYGAGYSKEDGVVGFHQITSSSGNFTNFYANSNPDILTESVETGLRTRLRVGAVEHRISTAFVDYWSDTETRAPTGTFGPPQFSNIYNPIRLIPPNLALIPRGESPFQRLNNKSFVVADTMALFDDRVLLTVGDRRQEMWQGNFQNNPSLPNFRGETSVNSQGRWSPGYAAVVKPTERLSLYTNYIEGLINTGVAPLGTRNAGAALPPTVGEQFEYGAKYDFGTVGLTVSRFTIEQAFAFTNTVTNVYELAGRQRNDGVEVEIFGEPIKGWRLLGGFAYINARLLRTDRGLFDDHVAPGVPKRNLSLYTEYDVFNWGGYILTLTGRVINASSQFYDPANLQSIPSWTRYDAGVRLVMPGYNGKPITIRANVENLAGYDYWQSTAVNFLQPGTPRTFLVSSSFEW